MKGIYVLTPDGMLHEQVMTTGADFAPPVKFLPAANASSFGLNFNDKMIVTATGRDCGGVPNGLWAIDLASADYTVANYATQQVRPLALTGPVITPDGNSIVVTGPGTSDSNSGVYAGSVVSVAKDMKVEDWYTPDGGMASYESVSPVAFTYKEKQLVVAPGKDGQSRPCWTLRRWAARITTLRSSKHLPSPKLAKSMAGMASRLGRIRKARSGYSPLSPPESP